MENKNLELEIREINRKLDFISSQMQEYQAHQKEIKELKDDLSLIAKDMFDAAVEELEEVSPYFDSSDLIHLGKKLLRNTRNLNKMLTQVEGAADLFQDLRPIGKEIFDELLETLNELDRKGYFEFFSEALKIIDTVVTTFSVEDVRLLRENIASILLTIKNMDIDAQKDVSLFHLLKQLKDPEVKKGLAFSLEFIKNMARSSHKK